MFGIPFWFLGGFLTILLFGLEIDAGYAFTTFLLTQANLEAASIAGDTQQKQVVEGWTNGAPSSYGFYLLTDGTPQQVAQDTWNKNAANFGPGPWDNATPTFNLSRQDTVHTPSDQLDTVQATVSETVPMAFSNQNFGTSVENTVSDTVTSTIHNTQTYNP